MGFLQQCSNFWCCLQGRKITQCRRLPSSRAGTAPCRSLVSRKHLAATRVRCVSAVRREPVYSIEQTAEQVIVTVHMPGVNGVAEVELDLCDGWLCVEAGVLQLKL